MKSNPITVLFTLLAVLAGCEQPAEVQLIGESDGVEVTSLVVNDTSLALSPIDSSALLPADEIQFDGTLLLNHVQIDAGSGVQKFSFARGLILDRNRPVRSGGRTLGYHGFHLGEVLLNGDPMVPRLHWVPAPDSLVWAGFEYTQPPGFAYEEGGTYTWSSDSMNAIGISITAPGILNVQSPRGGTAISHDADLVLEWTGGDDVIVVVSIIREHARPRPILHLKPRRQGHAIVPAKMLRLLPRGHLYAFTFINANRKVITVSRRFFHGEVLVQAASVYNAIVFLP